MIFRIIFAIIILYILYRVAKGLALSMSKKERLSSGAGGAGPDRTAVKGEDLVEDPFCHTYVPLTAAIEASEDGRKIYFCSRECLEKYKKSQSR